MTFFFFNWKFYFDGCEIKSFIENKTESDMSDPLWCGETLSSSGSHVGNQHQTTSLRSRGRSPRSAAEVEAGGGQLTRSGAHVVLAADAINPPPG